MTDHLQEARYALRDFDPRLSPALQHLVLTNILNHIIAYLEPDDDEL